MQNSMANTQIKIGYCLCHCLQDNVKRAHTHTHRHSDACNCCVWKPPQDQLAPPCLPRHSPRFKHSWISLFHHGNTRELSNEHYLFPVCIGAGNPRPAIRVQLQVLETVGETLSHVQDGSQIARANKFCTAEPNIFGSSALNLLMSPFWRLEF